MYKKHIIKKLIQIKLLLIMTSLNSCVSIATMLNQRDSEDVIIKKSDSKVTNSINVELINDDIKISAKKITEYVEDKTTYPKGSKNNNLSTLSASGSTILLSGVSFSLIKNPKPGEDSRLLGFIMLGTLLADMLFAALIEDLDKKIERNNKVESESLNGLVYKITIGKKSFDGTLNENGFSIIEDVVLTKNDLEYGNAKINISMPENINFSQEIPIEKFKNLVN